MFAGNKFTSLRFEIMETAVELIRAYIPYPHFENQKNRDIEEKFTLVPLM